MMRRTVLALIALTTAAALTGCLRQDGTYTLNENNTVDGTILLALATGTADPPPTSSGMDAAGVAAGFVNATVTDLGQPGWVGDRITFVGEPLSTFATATDDWEIAVSRVGTQYVVAGAAILPSEAGSKQTVIDQGGSMTLKVTFPGPVADHNGSLSGNTVTWNMLTQTTAPYARGSAVPPPPPAAPDPVVTVVISPSPSTHVVTTPSPSASPSASPSPTPTVLAASSDADGTSIPIWVWIIGAVLLSTVVGLGSFLLATKGAASRSAVPAPAPTPAPAPAPAPEPEPEPSVPPTKPTPKVKPKGAHNAEPPASDDD